MSNWQKKPNNNGLKCVHAQEGSDKRVRGKDTRPSYCRCGEPLRCHWYRWCSHGWNAAGSWSPSVCAGSMSGAQRGWFSWWLRAGSSRGPGQSWMRRREAQIRAHVTHCGIHTGYRLMKGRWEKSDLQRWACDTSFYSEQLEVYATPTPFWSRCSK